MSFIDSLDEEGKQLYNNYIIHCNRWINYIRPKAIKKLNDYLDTSKKTFYQYEYINYSVIQDTIKVNKEPSKDITAKYKKLSLLFHPDKYNNSHSTEFFSLINKIYSDNNEVLINAIDTVAHLILELDNLKNIIANLDDLNITNITQNITNVVMNSKNTNDANYANTIFTILNSNLSDTLKQQTNTENICNTHEDFDENFLNSTYYTFYKNNEHTIKYINETFITEEELIKKITNASIYKVNFINFCGERYVDNKNILTAVCEWKMKENAELSKENEKMREMIKILGK